MKVLTFLLVNVVVLTLLISCARTGGGDDADDSKIQNATRTSQRALNSCTNEPQRINLNNDLNENNESGTDEREQVNSTEYHINEPQAYSNEGYNLQASSNIPRDGSHVDSDDTVVSDGDGDDSDEPLDDSESSKKQVAFIEWLFSFWNIVAMVGCVLTLLIVAFIIRYEYKKKQCEEF